MSEENSTNQHSKENGELTDFLEKDMKDSAERKPKKVTRTMLEHLSSLRKNRSESLLAHATIYSMIKNAGYEEISYKTDPRRAKILGLGPDDMLRVPKFYKGFYGIEPVLVEIDKYYFAAAGQGEESRQILYFVGPPGSGKSTLAERDRQGLEHMGFWEIEGCSHHNDPVDVIPRHIREELNEKFGIYVHPRADICSQCRWKLKNELNNDWTKFKVVWRSYSQRGSCGIAVVSEVDPTNFDIGVLIGTEDISLLGKYERGDPRTLVLKGACSRGNRGRLEIVEIFKNPPEAQRPLITLTQEKYVPLPKFVGQNYADTSVVAHSNEAEWNKFRSDQTNEAILNRIKIVKVPYNTRLTEEVDIYKNSFLARSTMFRNIHIDPHSLEQAAMFALLTRLAPSVKCDPLTKLRIYDGQKVIEKGEVKKITLVELKEEAGLQEGHKGLSPRDIMKEIVEECLAAYRDQWEQDPELQEREGYLNPTWIRDAMVRYVQKQDIPEDADWPKPSRKRWLAFIQDTLHKEFLRVLEDDITKSFVVAFDEQAEAIFQKYLDNVLAAKNPDRDKVSDRITRERRDPDLKFLESIEQHIGITGTQVDAFRQEVATALFDLQRTGEKITWKSYEPLREAIEEKIKASVKDMVRIIVKKNIRDEVQQKKHDTVVDALQRLGYAKFGIEIILRYAENNLWRD